MFMFGVKWLFWHVLHKVNKQPHGPIKHRAAVNEAALYINNKVRYIYLRQSCWIRTETWSTLTISDKNHGPRRAGTESIFAPPTNKISLCPIADAIARSLASRNVCYEHTPLSVRSPENGFCCCRQRQIWLPPSRVSKSRKSSRDHPN